MSCGLPPVRISCMQRLLAMPASRDVCHDPLREIFASLLTGRMLGLGILPATLGLPGEDFANLLASYFPGYQPSLKDGAFEEIPELEDLLHMMLEYRATNSPPVEWACRILAYGCRGRDHLWQDLGLQNRGELSRLFDLAVPTLAALNVHDMKWKKFLYKHYCAREGIYVCPAPSCGECADHDFCFGSET